MGFVDTLESHRILLAWTLSQRGAIENNDALKSLERRRFDIEESMFEARTAGDDQRHTNLRQLRSRIEDEMYVARKNRDACYTSMKFNLHDLLKLVPIDHPLWVQTGLTRSRMVNVLPEKIIPIYRWLNPPLNEPDGFKLVWASGGRDSILCWFCSMQPPAVGQTQWEVGKSLFFAPNLIPDESIGELDFTALHNDIVGKGESIHATKKDGPFGPHPHKKGGPYVE